ncbi:glycine betaine ABC transporter substrate-binding protein [Natrialbaceae archaeon GCM10025810]|uniref:glycine betaine ABC transporter substrate-binding protein n=1 Tax=Halovalidus salilacus TaxID=3075124 RepID=UPI0036132A00
MPQRNTRREVLRATGAAAGVGALAGCSSLFSGDSEGSVTVGSKNFTEQKILGYIAYHALSENTDLSIEDQVNLGGTNTNFEALRNGDTDLYWEYTGTAWQTLPPQHDSVITDEEEIYDEVKAEFEDEHDITLLERGPFDNTYVLLTNENWHEETGVETLSDLADYVKDGNTDVTVVMNAEFQERSDGWPGLIEAYDFESEAEELTVDNVDSGLTYQVVGEDEADVGMGFNTDPNILEFDLVVLEDDEEFFPVYNPVPLVRMDALEENDSIESGLEGIAETLSNDTILELNRKVSIDEENAEDVARKHLQDNDLI